MQFSVKSAYLSLKHEQNGKVLDLHGESSDKTKITQFWKKVRRVKVQDKVKIFIWRLYHNLLPVAVNLRNRGCEVILRCWFCHFLEESSAHVFLKCLWARAFWSALGGGQ